eukprot:g64555.t1
MELLRILGSLETEPKAHGVKSRNPIENLVKAPKIALSSILSRKTKIIFPPLHFIALTAHHKISDSEFLISESVFSWKSGFYLGRQLDHVAPCTVYCKDLIMIIVLHRRHAMEKD